MKFGLKLNNNDVIASDIQMQVKGQFHLKMLHSAMFRMVNCLSAACFFRKDLYDLRSLYIISPQNGYYSSPTMSVRSTNTEIDFVLLFTRS